MSDPILDVGPEAVKAEGKQLTEVTPKVEEKQAIVTAPAVEANGEDDEYPTDEEIETLRHVPGRIPWICFTVAFVELCERFAYYGTTIVRKFKAN